MRLFLKSVFPMVQTMDSSLARRHNETICTILLIVQTFVPTENASSAPHVDPSMALQGNKENKGQIKKEARKLNKSRTPAFK